MSLQKSTTPGKTIRHLRHVKDLKQSVVAHKMGISQQAYSKLEAAKMPTQKI